MPTYFQERKDFLSRMVDDIPKGAWRREMGFTKKIFEAYPVDFLSVVKRPFPMDSLAYFIGEDGIKYLELQLKLFQFKPAKVEIVEGTRSGEDLEINHRLSIREFLLDE